MAQRRSSSAAKLDEFAKAGKLITTPVDLSGRAVNVRKMLGGMVGMNNLKGLDVDYIHELQLGGDSVIDNL